jgi:hypothetical protein
VYIRGGSLAITRAETSPICSPWRIEALRLGIRITREVGPETAEVMDLGSLIVLAAGIIDPSEAHEVLLWGEAEGEKPQVEARAKI